MHAPKLLDQVRAAIRLKHYSIRTDAAYLPWGTRFVRFHNKRHPNQLGAAAVAAFLPQLAVDAHGSAATHNQALAALLCLSRAVLHQERGVLDSGRARTDRRLPSVLTRDEVQQVIARLTGAHALMARLRSGSGLRLMECARLRIKNLDFSQRQLMVCDGNGVKDRVTILPHALVAPLHAQLQRARHLHALDLDEGCGAVELPYARTRKYPNAALD